MKKRCVRRVVTPMPPRGLRPKLDPSQLVDLEIVHITLLDDLVHGRGTDHLLWNWVGSMLTWSRASELMGAGIPEMVEQLALATAVIERYARTGSIGLTGPEYQLAKDGINVMTELAKTVDRPRAIAAALWSENRVQQMAANCRQNLPASRRNEEHPCT